jgi:TolB-like protein
MVMPWASAKALEAAAPDPKSVAVLPFASISADPSDQYFADGLTEELIATTSRIKELSVISRTSVMQYKQSSKSMVEIGRELRAGTILEGSVRKAGNRVRVTIQMIDSAKDHHLWAENFDRVLEDIFEIQSEIASRVAESLKIQLLAETRQLIGLASTRDVAAHDLYLQGLASLNTFTTANIEAAVGLFEKALVRDPSFAMAHARLAQAYAFSAGETAPLMTGFAKAREHAQRAVQLDDSLSEAHCSLGILAIQDFADWSTAERELKRAIELNPSNAVAHWWYGEYLMVRKGDLTEGVLEEKRGEELDPLSPSLIMAHGISILFSRRYDEAIAKLRQSNDYYSHSHLSAAYVITGNLEEAVTEARRGVEESTGAVITVGFLGYALGRAGRTAEAKELIAGLEKEDRWGVYSPYSLSLVYLGLGEYDRTMDLLEEAARNKDSSLLLSSPGVFAIFDPIRSEPRFGALLNKLGLALVRPE